MFGGIQPERLRSCLVNSDRGDGFIQRFQVMVYPDPPAKIQYVDRLPDKPAAELAERIFRELVKLNPKSPERYRFAPDAQEFFVKWMMALEERLLQEDSPALISHLKKYPGLMASLALLFELADRAAVGDITKGTKDNPNDFEAATVDFVSLEHAQQAVAWCDYLESHARRIYSCQVSDEVSASLKLANAIQSGKVAAKFTSREALRKVRSLKNVAEVKAAIKELKGAGWLRSAGSVVPEGGGTPSEMYEVNPEVYKKLT
jgi:hypothetical protein